MMDNDPDDVRNTKRHLNRTGHFDDEVENDFITRELDEGIKDFQKDNDLRVDGVLNPGEETERSLFGLLTGRNPDHVFGRQDEDNHGSVGFGGNVSGTLLPKKTKRKSSPHATIFAPDPAGTGREGGERYTFCLVDLILSLHRRLGYVYGAFIFIQGRLIYVLPFLHAFYKRRSRRHGLARYVQGRAGAAGTY